MHPTPAAVRSAQPHLHRRHAGHAQGARRSRQRGPYPTPLARIPRVDETECVGCNLCSLVCPVDECITMVQVETGLAPETWAERTRETSPAREPAAAVIEDGERMASLLIQHGTVVNADSTSQADVLIDGAAIKEVRRGIPATAADTVVDATGLLLLPGGIDAHTHLDMPFGGTTSADDFLTGTRAAAIGGTTTIVDFAIQARGTKMRTALDTWWKKAEGKACIDYGLHMIVTDLPDAGLEDMDDLVREGVASFKLFMAYPNVLMVDDATIFKAMRQTAKNGALICMHAENGSVIDVIVQQALAEGKTAPIYHALTRPTRAEAEAVHRAIAMAEMAGVPVYIVHLSSEDALNQVREARDRGLPAFAETCPQYLLLSIEDNMQDKGWEGAKYVFTPPLREKRNQPKLWDGLRKDNLQVVSTDHCPFCFEDQKALGKDDFTKIPNGGPGIENRLQLLHHHGVGQGNLTSQPLRRARLHRARAHLRHVSQEGRARPRQRRRHRALGSRRRAHHQRRNAPHARRLLHVRGLPRERQCPRCLLARRAHRAKGRVHRQTRPRPVSAPRSPRRRVEVMRSPPICALDSAVSI